MTTPDVDTYLKHLKVFFEQKIPFNRFVGLVVEQLEVGACTLRIPWRDELIGDPTRPALHGGVTSMIADTACGAACFTSLPSSSDRLSTVDLRVDYLRPGTAADIWCRGTVMRMGNRVAVARSEVFDDGLPTSDEESKPIATAIGVYNVVRR